MDAVVTAGGIPQPEELLYPYTQGKPKAMLDIGGKPMVQWVLDALSGSKLAFNTNTGSYISSSGTFEL
jgi:NDP-sugar pyrophosphorylase family protein